MVLTKCQVISLIARYLVLSYLNLTCIFYLVIGGDTIDINVLVAIIQWRKKAFSDFLKKIKNS